MKIVEDINGALAGLAKAYLLIDGIRADSGDIEIQLLTSRTLVSITEAQEGVFGIKMLLEQ